MMANPIEFRYYLIVGRPRGGTGTYQFLWEEPTDVTPEKAVFSWGQRYKSYYCKSCTEIDRGTYLRLKSEQFL